MAGQTGPAQLADPAANQQCRQGFLVTLSRQNPRSAEFGLVPKDLPPHGLFPEAYSDMVSSHITYSFPGTYDDTTNQRALHSQLTQRQCNIENQAPGRWQIATSKSPSLVQTRAGDWCCF